MNIKEIALKKPPKMNIGLSSLVVIFAVLCLTVFSVLSLSSAIVEKNLAEKSAASVKEYYEADFKAAEYVDKLKEIYSFTGEFEDSSLGLEFEIEEALDGKYVSYAVPINESQAISVVLKFSVDKMNIEEWKVVQTGDWTPDDSLNVWDGGDL
ncbi:MAG: hypothetical protein VB120_02035 [Lachnospiraceae bacterium]|nr:hypothetical protein [Lachnospiraceae bacterium]